MAMQVRRRGRIAGLFPKKTKEDQAEKRLEHKQRRRAEKLDPENAPTRRITKGYTT